MFGGIAVAPISGLVVDSETGQPIEGVSVLAHWDRVGGHGFITERVIVIETLTDKSGKYSLPSWGPELSSLSNVTLMEYPKMHFFKLGHYPRTLREKSIVIHGTRDIDRLKLTSSWDGKTIKLGSMKQDDLEEYAKIVSSQMGVLGMLMFEKKGSCYWESFPATISSFMLAKRYFLEQGVFHVITDYENLSSSCNH